MRRKTPLFASVFVMPFLLMLLGLVFEPLAQAAPSAFVSRWGSLMIENTTSSTLLRDSEKSQTVWVLPPSAGQAQFSHFSGSANLGFCTGLKSLIKASNRFYERIEELEQRLPAFETRVEAARAALNLAREQLAQVGKAEGFKDLILLRDELDALDMQRQELLDQVSSCSRKTCDVLMATYKQMSQERQQLFAELQDLKRSHRAASRAYMNAEHQVEIKQVLLDEEQDRFLTYFNKINQLQEQLSQMFVHKAQLSGGYAGIDYRSGWSENVRSLEESYGDFDFKAIPTRNARIFAHIPGVTDRAAYLSHIPMVLDYSVNGQKQVPWGERDLVASALPDTLVGDFHLGLVGACPLADPHFFDGTGFQPQTQTSSGPMFGLSASFEYPAAFKFDVEAHFNLYKVFERISKKSSHGGFFSSKAYASVLENDWGKESFHIDWQVEDPDQTLDFNERQNIERALKTELMDRALNIMARPSDAPGFSQPQLPVAPEPGAILFARGLDKVCGWNLYCKGGSWLLMGARSVWGSDHAESRFRQEFNRSVSERWSSQNARYVPATITYRRG